MSVFTKRILVLGTAEAGEGFIIFGTFSTSYAPKCTNINKPTFFCTNNTKMSFTKIKMFTKHAQKLAQSYPLDRRRKLNVHKTFRTRLGRHLNILCTFNLRPVSRG